MWAVGTSAGIHASAAAGVLAPGEPDTAFNAASLIKILAVWSSIGALREDGGPQPPTDVGNAFRELVFS